MSAEIIAIGNEVLRGYTVNSNAAYISQQLLIQLGLTVERHSALPDEPTLLKQGLAEALQRSQLIICTGGLGPTGDDITRKVAAELFSCELQYNRAVADHLLKRYGPQLTTLEDQATIPSKALPLHNSVGTAPGLLLWRDRALMTFLPGVPTEMQTMLTEQLIPYLAAQEIFVQKKRPFRHILHFWGIKEELIDQFLGGLCQQNPQLSYGIYPEQGVLSVHLITCSAESAEAEKLLAFTSKQLSQRFLSHHFIAPSGQLAEAVQREFTQRGATLSLAESCTGGAIAASLTRHSGASNYFLGGVVVYSNALKRALVDVPQHLLDSYGAVSCPVVSAMALGIRQRTQSSWSIAVSGIAGPTGATPDKPVGTVWLAIAGPQAALHTWQIKAPGNRASIIAYSTNVALGHLLSTVASNPASF